MAIQLGLQILLDVFGDGSSTSLSVNLSTDAVQSGNSGPFVNNFDLAKNLPTSVGAISQPITGVTITGVISGHTLTLTFSGPFTGQNNVIVNLLF